tara:strand:- start:19 stop:912 length:894 start_codon:yes stop_codon:yes gene_type:complete
VKSKNEKKILFIGGGRWAQIYLDQLQKLKLSICVITSNQNLKKKLLNSKFSKIYTFKKFKDVKVSKNLLIILCNKTNKRLNILKKLSKLKNKILIEKPLTNNPKNYFDQGLYNKKNIYLSSQFYFAKYFLFVKEKIKKEKIEKINLDWFDSENDKKSFNNKLNFIEDAYYHFFSIIRVFTDNKNLINNLSHIKKNNITTFNNGIKIILKASKGKYKKKRVLHIQTDKTKYSINFKSLDKVLIKKNDKKFTITKDVKNLPIQIKNFILDTKEIKKNSLKSLKFLFQDLMKIKNVLSKN